MSIDHTCNSSFWTREKDKIFENTLVIYFNDNNLFTKMEEALPGKSLDYIKDHYNIFLEDTGAIDFGHVPLPNYIKMQSNGNKNTITYIEWRRGTAWTEEEHMLVYCVHFLRVISSGLRHCVITRTPTQLPIPKNISRALKQTRKETEEQEKNQACLILLAWRLNSVETFQVPNTVDLIVPDCGGSQEVPNSGNDSMFPQESTNAEHMTTVVGGELSGQNAY
uniref:Myb-like domain-containing protein n=1 Tax=Solanum lycopersicum TaxID=4081 RepID=A0A3Q7I183_SOLLC